MIRLFQIGDVRLYYNLFKDMDDLLIPREADAIAESFSVAWSLKKQFAFGGMGIKTKSFTLKEILFSTNAYTIDQRISDYTALVSRPYVHIFGYIDRGICPDLDIDGYIEEPVFDDNLFWVYTTGIVTKVKPNRKDNMIDVEIDYQPAWESVNRMLWSYGKNVTTNTYTPAYNVTDIQAVPMRVDISQNGTQLFNRRFYNDNLMMYDPRVWAVLHTARPIGYPETGIGTNWTTVTNFNFHVDKKEWSVAPRSMYQFRYLPTSGGIRITASSQDNIWGTREVYYYLSLDELNLSMASAGYTAIDTNDRIVIGDYNGRISFVIRNNQILDNVVPKWTYNSEYLGQTGFGYNLISASLPASTTEMAQLHTFRMV